MKQTLCHYPGKKHFNLGFLCKRETDLKAGFSLSGQKKRSVRFYKCSCVCVQSVHIFFSRMSNMIYLLPVTCLMWLLIGSHSAISRQVQYYLSELIWAGKKHYPMLTEQNHMLHTKSLFLFPFEVLHLYLVLTCNSYQDTVHSQTELSKVILPVEVSQQRLCSCGSWARL